MREGQSKGLHLQSMGDFDLVPEAVAKKLNDLSMQVCIDSGFIPALFMSVSRSPQKHALLMCPPTR